MALQENKDSFKVNSLSLSEFVLQCSDCHLTCFDKTARVVENRSRAPRGWDALFDSVANERRSEDLEECESRCQYMQSACPSMDKVAQYEAALEKTAEKTRKGKADPSLLQEASRCEHAVEVFSNVLFALAHKPSKVSFDTSKDLRSGGEKYDEAKNGAPTEAHRKVLEGAKNIDSEILRRWSKARHDRLQMEEQGIIQPSSSHGAAAAPAAATPTSGASGTTPKW